MLINSVLKICSEFVVITSLASGIVFVMQVSIFLKNSGIIILNLNTLLTVYKTYFLLPTGLDLFKKNYKFYNKKHLA